MTDNWWLIAVPALGLCVLVLAALVITERRARRRETERAETRYAELSTQLSALQNPGGLPRSESATPVVREYVITDLAEPTAAVPTSIARRDQDDVLAGRVDRTQFADILARETTIRALSLAHGLRRAMSPQSRNQIRFVMKQEVKRSRRDRKVETRQALREYRARQRERLDDPVDEDVA